MRAGPGGAPSHARPPGKPFTAERSKIPFVKERGVSGRRLYAVTFNDQQHDRWFWLVAAERDPTGSWDAVAGAGGSDQSPGSTSVDGGGSAACTPLERSIRQVRASE